MDRDDQGRRKGQGEESFPELLERVMPESARLEPGA